MKDKNARIIPVKFDGILTEILDNLVDSGLYSSKAEAIRSGLRLLIEKHDLKVKKR